jgi:hypothetical protein
MISSSFYAWYGLALHFGGDLHGLLPAISDHLPRCTGAPPPRRTTASESSLSARHTLGGGASMPAVLVAIKLAAYDPTGWGLHTEPTCRPPPHRMTKSASRPRWGPPNTLGPLLNRKDPRPRGPKWGPHNIQGTSLTRQHLPLGPYTRTMPRALWWS